MLTRIILVAAIVAYSTCPADAGLFFHATKKESAEKIQKKGFNAEKMNPKARFGSGLYASKSKSLAFREKPGSDSIVVLKGNKTLQQHTIDTSRLSKNSLKRLSGDNDLRGNIHNKVIGPKLGHKLGDSAAKTYKAIAFKSAKGNGSNIFIPKNLYNKHPQLLQPRKTKK